MCYIGTDNVAAGRQAGQLIREAIPDGGSIMLFVGKLDAQNAQERIQGIKEALEGSTIRIIDVRTDDADDVRAKANAADTLVRYPDIKGLVGLWSYNGPAILNAVREAGKVGRVQIVAFDEADETLAGVKDGAIHGTVVQQPYEFGYQAIVRMAQAVRGDDRSSRHQADHRADAGGQPLERRGVHQADQRAAGPHRHLVPRASCPSCLSCALCEDSVSYTALGISEIAHAIDCT